MEHIKNCEELKAALCKCRAAGDRCLEEEDAYRDCVNAGK